MCLPVILPFTIKGMTTSISRNDIFSDILYGAEGFANLPIIRALIFPNFSKALESADTKAVLKTPAHGKLARVLSMGELQQVVDILMGPLLDNAV